MAVRRAGRSVWTPTLALLAAPAAPTRAQAVSVGLSVTPQLPIVVTVGQTTSRRPKPGQPDGRAGRGRRQVNVFSAVATHLIFDVAGCYA
jgi:hypothetical protein